MAKGIAITLTFVALAVALGKTIHDLLNDPIFSMD